MAGGVSLPGVLQLLDGTPHKKVGSAIFENMPLAKVLQGGNVSGLMGKVLADGNLSSVLMNPMAAITEQLQGLAVQAATRLQAAFGSDAGGLISALTGGSGLTTALAAFQAAGDNLSGLTNGQAGLFALAGHDSLLAMLGGSAPPALAASRVVGPLASGDLLNGIASALPGVVQSVIDGTLPLDAATSWVQGQTATIAGVTADSADALAQGQAAQMLASTVATVSGLVAPVPGIAPSPIQRAMSATVKPAAAVAMRQALAVQVAATTHAAIDTAAITSLDS